MTWSPLTALCACCIRLVPSGVAFCGFAFGGHKRGRVLVCSVAGLLHTPLLVARSNSATRCRDGSATLLALIRLGGRAVGTL